MSYSLIESYVSQALTCTEQMLRLAENSEWDALTELEAERSEIFDAIFNHSALPAMLGKIADSIRKIVEIDQKTISISKIAHHSLKKEMELLTHGKKAVDAYLQNII